MVFPLNVFKDMRPGADALSALPLSIRSWTHDVTFFKKFFFIFIQLRDRQRHLRLGIRSTQAERPGGHPVRGRVVQLPGRRRQTHHGDVHRGRERIRAEGRPSAHAAADPRGDPAVAGTERRRGSRAAAAAATAVRTARVVRRRPVDARRRVLRSVVRFRPVRSAVRFRVLRSTVRSRP